MQTVIKNKYKAAHLFICRHPIHKRFDFIVSPYHVLKQKKCFGSGCVEFLWRCKIHAKGKKCPRGYLHVGRNCFSCKHYYEEKICRVPEPLMSQAELETFLKDLVEYEYWLSTVEGKTVPFEGTVSAIQPWLQKIIDTEGSFTHLKGFLISFKCGYIGDELFDDTVYLRIGRRFLVKWNPVPGDDLEFEAILSSDRGRVVLSWPKRVEITRNGGDSLINYSRAVVGRATGAIVQDDVKTCRECPFGALLDVIQRHPKPDQYRRFFCLRGVSQSADCPVRLEFKLECYKREQVIKRGS